MPISYDAHSYELAEYFLPSHPKFRDELAQRIQQAIEDFISEKEIEED